MNTKSCILTVITIITLLFNSCGSKKTNQQNSDAGTNIQTPTTIKLKPIVFGGNRYVAETDFGLDKNVPMMVHGNAGFYMMLTHEIAEQLNNGKPVEKISDYGYSNKGRGRINIEKFQISDRIFTDIKDVSVFDWPEEEGKAAQGMLGINFLINEKVQIDFVKEEMTIGVEQNEQPEQSLLDQGYTYTKLHIEKGRGYMNVYFDALKKEIPITVGTVADDYSLDLATFQQAIETIQTESEGHSPSGTTPALYSNVAPIKYSIAGEVFKIPTTKAGLYSFAEYNNVEQADVFPFGIFGRDWMKQNNAIIDYANNFVYFKKS